MKTIFNVWKYLNYFAVLILFVVSANRIYPIIYENFTQDQIQMKLLYVIYATLSIVTFVVTLSIYLSSEYKLTKKRLIRLLIFSLAVYPLAFLTVLPYILIEITDFYILLSIFVSMLSQLVIRKMNMKKNILSITQ